MSDTVNPYQSPEADTKTVSPLVSQSSLTEPMMKYLNEASPWLRFLGVVGFIGSGLMVAGGLLCLVIMPLAKGILNAASDFFSFSAVLDPFIPLMAVYALYFIGAGTLMFFPALFTYRFGERIRSFFQTNSEGELELAFRNNRSLWKFKGILTIIGLAAFPVIIIITIIIAVAVMAIG